MVPQHIIEQIRQTADIADVVSDFVSLKKRGANMLGCCPFHNEKTPSFNVNPARGIFKCFGCGKAGDVITFVKEIESLNYIEAIKWLGNKYGIEVPDVRPDYTSQEQQEYSEKESLLKALNWAKNWFIAQMKQTSEGNIAQSYFKERGFIVPTQEKFELGYSPNEKDALFQAAIKEGFTQEVLDKAGLISIKEDGKILDRFRGRVIFPIHNQSGKVIAFGARTLSKEKTVPKYLNSPETLVYHKSAVLYGIYQAKQEIRNKDNAYLTEGYTDVISLSQAGIRNAVASSGTSLTTEQIKLLSRYSKTITVLYDGDAAGIKASIRGIDMLLEEGLQVYAITFPNGDDPDSYLQKVGSEEFSQYLQQAKTDFLSFKVSLYREEMRGNPIRKTEVVKEIVASINKIPDVIGRSVYLKQAAQLLEVEESLLVGESNYLYLQNQQAQLKKERQKAYNQPPAYDGNYDNGEYPPYPPPPLPDDLAPLEQEYLYPKQLPQSSFIKEQLQLYESQNLRKLLLFGDTMLTPELSAATVICAELDTRDFENAALGKLYHAYKRELALGNTPNVEFFLTHTDEGVATTAINLVMETTQPSPHWYSKFSIVIPEEKENLREHIKNELLRLKLKKIEEQALQTQQDISKAKEEEQLNYLMEKLMSHLEDKKKISALLKRVVN